MSIKDARAVTPVADYRWKYVNGGNTHGTQGKLPKARDPESREYVVLILASACEKEEALPNQSRCAHTISMCYREIASTKNITVAMSWQLRKGGAVDPTNLQRPKP